MKNLKDKLKAFGAAFGNGSDCALDNMTGHSAKQQEAEENSAKIGRAVYRMNLADAEYVQFEEL